MKTFTKWTLSALIATLFLAVFPLKSEARNLRGQYNPTVSVTHGFRTGALYIANMTRNDLDRVGFAVPTTFVMGYEAIEMLSVNPYMNVLFAQNLLLGGFEQSTLFGSFNAVLGIDFMQTFQFGVGINITGGENWSHMVAFVSWTPHVGDVLIPVTLSYVPDKDGHHRIGMTIGVSWSHVIGRD